MVRIVGVNIPDSVQIVIGLQNIYGIGKARAQLICSLVNVNEMTKIKDLSSEKMDMIRNQIASFTIEGDLKRSITMNIKRLIDLKCYRGIRHIKGLPVRGQRTKTNARTRKGPRKAIAGKKKAILKK